MAATPDGIALQDFTNAELTKRGIDSVATIVEGVDNFDLGVHIRGAVSEHFVLKGAHLEGLGKSKGAIAERLDSLSSRASGASTTRG